MTVAVNAFTTRIAPISFARHEHARVVRATPARVFDREALNAVRRWKFEPIDAATTTRRTLAFNPG